MVGPFVHQDSIVLKDLVDQEDPSSHICTWEDLVRSLLMDVQPPRPYSHSPFSRRKYLH
jgi:hypothetical protein